MINSGIPDLPLIDIKSEDLPVYILTKHTYLYEYTPKRVKIELKGISKSIFDLESRIEEDPLIAEVIDEFDYLTWWVVKSKNQALAYLKKRLYQDGVISGYRLFDCFENHIQNALLYNPLDQKHPLNQIGEELRLEFEKLLNTLPIEDRVWEEYLEEKQK